MNWRTFFGCVVFVFSCFIGFTQDYVSKTYDFGDTIAFIPIKVLAFNQGLILGTRTNTADNTFSSIMHLDKNLNFQYFTHYPDIAITRQSLHTIGDKYYMYGNSFTNTPKIALQKLDSDYSELGFFNYASQTNTNPTSSSVSLDGHIYGVGDDQFGSSFFRETHMKKLDTLGNQIWAKNLFQENDYSVTWEIETTSDKSLLLSGDFFQGPTCIGRVIKLDTDGEEVWRYVAEEPLESCAVGHWSTELSNNDIVTLSTVNRGDSLEFIANDWIDRPPKFTWISPEGEKLQEKVIPTLSPQGIESIGIYSSGLESHFYGMGTMYHPDALGYYGWLVKLSNDGEIIWMKKYHDPLIGEEGFHVIENIIELENGDIITSGRIIRLGQSTLLWMMRLDENGCLDDGYCGEDVPILTKTHDIQNDEVKLYPNPVSDEIQIGLEGSFSFQITDVSGKIVLTGVSSSSTIGVSNLSSGYYFLNLRQKGKSLCSKFIKI